MAGGDDEGCAALCRKIRSDLYHYTAPFFAIAVAFVAFDVARKFEPLMDLSHWIHQLDTDIWFGSRNYIYIMSRLCLVAAAVRFTIELLSLFLFKWGGFKGLKILSMINMMTILIVMMPVIISGFSMVYSLSNIDSKKIGGNMFHAAREYENLIRQVNNSKPDANLTKEFEELIRKQDRLDFIQQAHFCCGMNGIHDWQYLLRPIYNESLAHINWNLHWWVECKKPASTVSPTTPAVNATNVGPIIVSSKDGCDIPYSCCSMTNSGGCLPENAFKPSCKTVIKEAASRCILWSCILLTCATILGGIGAMIFYSASLKGIESRKRYNLWLTSIGVKNDEN